MKERKDLDLDDFEKKEPRIENGAALGLEDDRGDGLLDHGQELGRDGEGREILFTLNYKRITLKLKTQWMVL